MRVTTFPSGFSYDSEQDLVARLTAIAGPHHRLIGDQSQKYFDDWVHLRVMLVFPCWIQKGEWSFSESQAPKITLPTEN